MSVPTRGEAYAKLMEHLRKCQEESSTLAHLANANDESEMARGWLKVSENFKAIQYKVMQFATKGFQ